MAKDRMLFSLKPMNELVFTAKPTAQQIKAARESAGLTQTQAAELVFSSTRAWQQWEAQDRGMHLAFWALFCYRIEALKRKQTQISGRELDE